MNRRTFNPDSQVIIGWREYVTLPDWGVEWIKAKADTGARTSAIDVANLETIADDKVRFDIVIDRNEPNHHVTIESPVVRWTRIKSSFGAAHARPVVATHLRIGPVEKTIELGLVCRKNMLCRMLLGRTALVPELVVDSAHRYIFGRKKAKKSKSATSSKRGSA